VLTNLFGSGPEYEEVNAVMAKAIDALKEQGAVIVRLEDPALDTDTLTAKFRLNEPDQGGTKSLFTTAGFARTSAFAGGNYRFRAIPQADTGKILHRGSEL
jgi:hypothetical protein